MVKIVFQKLPAGAKVIHFSLNTYEETVIVIMEMNVDDKSHRWNIRKCEYSYCE